MEHAICKCEIQSEQYLILQGHFQFNSPKISFRHV